MIGTSHQHVLSYNPCFFYNLREGTSQAGMFTFPFAAQREREKLAERVSHRFKRDFGRASAIA